MSEDSDHAAPACEPAGAARVRRDGAAGHPVPVVVAAVETLSTTLEELARFDPHDLPSAHLLALVRDLEDAARQLSAVQARVLAAVETDGLWAATGARSFAAWVRSETGASAPRATAVTRTARALRDHLHVAAAALAAGRITAEHAQILARHVTATPARIAALANPEVGQEFLVEAAERMDASDFSRVVRAWSVAADPQSADRDYASDLDREELVLARALRGWHVQGWLEDADGAVLATALDAYVGTPAAEDTRTTAQRRAAALVGLARMALDAGALQPGASIRPHLSVLVNQDTLLALADAQAPDTDPHRTVPEVSTGTAGPAPTGPTHFQTVRGEEALATPDHPAGEAGITPDLPAGHEAGTTMDLPAGHEAGTILDLPAGELESELAGDVVIPGEPDHARMVGHAPARLDDGTPIPPALLARLACDSELSRVIFGPASEVLDVGRAKRLFPPGQRRAVIARDGCCQYPGCDAPPSQGEIHHSIWWYAQHGSTRAADGVLLCWYHHAFVHANAITISRSPMNDADSLGTTWPPPTGGSRHTPRGGLSPRHIPDADRPHWRFYRRNGMEITTAAPGRRRTLRDTA